MKLKSFIESFGTVKLANKLKVSPQRVSSWKYGKTCPDHVAMLKLVKASKNTLTCDIIIREYVNSKKRVKNDKII